MEILSVCLPRTLALTKAPKLNQRAHLSITQSQVSQSLLQMLSPLLSDQPLLLPPLALGCLLLTELDPRLEDLVWDQAIFTKEDTPKV